MVGHLDCRHVCDDEESHHDDLDESDHVHEDHDHCSASDSDVCLVNLIVFTVLFGLYGVAPSSLMGLYDLV